MAMHRMNLTIQPTPRTLRNRYWEILMRLRILMDPPNQIHHLRGPMQRAVIGNNSLTDEQNGGMGTLGNRSDAYQNGHED